MDATALLLHCLINFCSTGLHQGEAEVRQRASGFPSHARRIRIDKGGDHDGRQERSRQDERRHRHAVGLLGRSEDVLQEERGISPGTGRKSRGRGQAQQEVLRPQGVGSGC